MSVEEPSSGAHTYIDTRELTQEDKLYKYNECREDVS